MLMPEPKYLLQGLFVVILLSLAGCDAFPEDPNGTMRRVQTAGVLTAGVVADEPVEVQEISSAQKVARAAGVHLKIIKGSSTILLRRLEKGRLDLVVGEFASESPWKGRVALTAPVVVNSAPADEPVLRAALQSGENRWLMFVSKTLTHGK